MDDVDLVLGYLKGLPDFELAIRGDDYWYASVPLCILDAIFSINARYEGVRAAVLRYATHYQLTVQRSKDVLPPENEQLTVNQLIAQITEYGPGRFAAEILRNRARTSTQSGILKAEASLHFAQVLRDHGVQVLQDLHGWSEDAELDRDLRMVRGQSSGIAVRYFFMLTGADHLIKPDRMILGFLGRQLHRSVGTSEAQTLLTAAAERLRTDHPAVTAQGLDYAIWSRERMIPKIVNAGLADDRGAAWPPA